MQAYLRYVNPGLAAVVLALCFWAATFEKGKTFDAHGLVSGGMHTYFFAKGLFSASAMLILGRVLLVLMRRDAPGAAAPSARRDAFYALAVAGATLGVLTGLFIDMQSLASRTRTEAGTRGIVILEHYEVRESKHLRVSGKLRNTAAETRWKEVEVRFFVDGKFALYCSGTHGTVAPGAEEYFSVECPNFERDRIAGDVTYQIETR